MVLDSKAFEPPKMNVFRRVESLQAWRSFENADFIQDNPQSDHEFFVSLITRREAFVMNATQFHRRYELYFLVSGSRRYFVDRRTYHVDAGSFVLIPPFCLHKTLEPETAGHSRLLFHFSPEDLPPGPDVSGWLHAIFQADQPIYTPTDRRMEQILPLLHTSAEILQDEGEDQSPARELMLKSLLTQILIQIHAGRSQDADPLVSDLKPQKQMPELVQDTLRYLQESYHRPVTLDQLAERFYVSKSQLSRSFKSATGFSIIEYLNNARIIAAQHCLLETRRPVSRIAEDVGFGSQSQFNRVFRQMPGKSATEFRQRHAELNKS